MSCQVEQIADCGDISSLARALFIPEKEDTNWLSQCCLSLSPCGSLLSVGYRNRLCILSSQWISSTDSSSFLISWSGSLSADITVILTLSICPSQLSSQNGPDWFCIVVGFKNGHIGFYTNTGHLLHLEKLDDKPVVKLSCHTGTYGTLADDIHVLYQTCECIISGSNLFQTLRNAKAQLAKVQAGIQDDYSVDSRSISIKKWTFTEQEVINDAAVVGLELKNTFDHLLAASTYGGYDVWYRSLPPMNTLIISAGAKPYLGFHYALEGGTAPPLQDVARAVAHKIKSALPHRLVIVACQGESLKEEAYIQVDVLRLVKMMTIFYPGKAMRWDYRKAAGMSTCVLSLRRGWLGGGNSVAAENAAAARTSSETTRAVRAEPLTMRCGLTDPQRVGAGAVVSHDRRLAAITDTYGRVAVLDLNRGHIIRLIKGCRDAQCAFVQIFEVDDKKQQLSTIKDSKRALFLIIYNPKKGLIDIRLMQRGNRVAVFTATKNGQLLYNTCGLVGAEKNYTSKKLNLPEFQCVLIDPDGRLKKFNIPFFFALEGENSQKSKDLQTLREFREGIKKTISFDDESCTDLLKVVAEIKTMDIKKYCLELLVKKYAVPPKFIMSCLATFWDSFEEEHNNMQAIDIKHYFANLTLVTLFYRHINNESTEDMQELTDKIHWFLQKENGFQVEQNSMNEDENDKFHLLEDDNCILERLLTLAQEKDYKEQQHARVKFAESNKSSYKDFVSCFLLTEKSKLITLKSDTSPEKLNNLASITFKCIFKMPNFNILSNFVKECNIDPKDIIKLLIMQVMNMSIDDISIELIEKCIAVLHYICLVSEEATKITYNEISPWWQSIRDTLVEMSCPLRSMIVAMACKAVSRIFECNSLEREDDINVWESITTENAKWGILIGKLEDISILSIVLAFKETFVGKSLPKLKAADYKINLKYIYTRGKGSVTELIAKWLCSMGVMPEAIVANELIEIHTSTVESDFVNDEDSSYLFVENNRVYVDENPTIFKWLSLLRRQFPLSSLANYVIANMCWEYAIAWQKTVQATALLEAVIHCLVHIADHYIQLGLFSIIWSTYIKHSFEGSCRLFNKMGRLPKDSFCLQDIGLDNTCMLKFLEITTNYLENFVKYSARSINEDRQKIEFEKIWDESAPSLVEVAQNTKCANSDILKLNYQISCTVYYQCHFKLKFSKPLDTLFDIDFQYVLEALTGHMVTREINLKMSDKVRNFRLKFLTKLIRAAVETVSVISHTDGPQTNYDNEECVRWIEKITVLAETWTTESDFLKRQQVIAFYHLGYDALAENLIYLIERPDLILTPILAITIQRMKRSLEQSSNQPEWIVSVPPQLYKRMQNTALDSSIPANPTLATTVTLLEKINQHMAVKQNRSSEDMQNMKMAEILIETCKLLLRRKL